MVLYSQCRLENNGDFIIWNLNWAGKFTAKSSSLHFRIKTVKSTNRIACSTDQENKLIYLFISCLGQTHEGNSAKLPTNDKESKSALPLQQRIIKQLLQTSTSLGRALSDLFVLLVKLSVGSAQRQRRAPHPNATPGLPTLPARFVAFQLTKLLKEAFSWQGLPSACSVPKPRWLKLTYITSRR